MRKILLFAMIILLSAGFATAESGGVVISEIAWMGTVSSANDEWIELFNSSDSEISLAGWTLAAEDGTPTIALSGVIAAGGFFLLERTDDTTISDISADQIYTGALGNTGEILILKNSAGDEIDRVDGWHAGDNSAKKSMERVDSAISGTDPANWADNDGIQISGLDADGAPLTATPRAQNSVFVDSEPLDTTPPVASVDPAGGLFAAPISVEFTADEPATFFYSFDSAAEKENFTQISAPLEISENATLRFFARDSAENDSEIASAIFEFDFDPPAVSADPPPGDFTDPPANSAPAIPTDFSPTAATNSRELSAIFSDPDDDIGTLEFWIFDFDSAPESCNAEDLIPFDSGFSDSINSGEPGSWIFPDDENFPDDEYFWCARAFDGEFDSAFSEIQNFALDTTAPEFPENAELIAEPGDEQIVLEWETASDFEKYFLQIVGGDLIEIAASETSFEKTELTNGQNYDFQFWAVDAAGNESAKLLADETPNGPTVETIAEPDEVLINEVAWAGSTNSSYDEWIELKNTTTNKIFDLDGWKIVDELDDEWEITFTAGKQIQPGEFFLFERNRSEEDSAVPDIPADDFFTGAISNDGEILILLDSAGSEIDRIDGSSGWIGGDSETKKTLARIDSENFRTSFEVDGTPKAANFREHDLAISAISASPGVPLPGESVEFSATIENRGTNSAGSFEIKWFVDGAEVSRESGENLSSFGSAEKTFSQNFPAGEFAISAEIEFPADEISENNSATTNLSVANHLVISEFAANPAGADGGAEWIELANPTDVAISLDGFEINSIAISGEIPAGGFFVLDNFTGLKNSADEILLRDSAGALVDSKNYSDAVEGRSLGRVAGDLSRWHEFHHPTKNSANELPENNSDPIAVITIQNSGNSTGACSLFVNLTAEDSADPDGDALEFEWDFGNSATSDESNPAGFYFTPGEYSVELTATDALGGTNSATQNFTVSGCSSGGGSPKISAKKTDEPIFDSLPAERVELKITEVSFSSAADWIEIFVANDGNSGNGIELGGFFFESDKRIKTIPKNTKLRTGEFLVLEFKSENPDKIERGDGFTKIFSARAGLTATDEQVALRDSTGAIEDAVIWENRDGKWSRGEDADVAEIVDSAGWISTEFADAVDSSVVEREVAIARFFDSAENKFPDSDSGADWFTTIFATPGSANSAPPVRAGEFNFQISEIFPRNPGGDSVKIICADCAESVALAGFALRNGLDEIIFAFPADAEISAASPVEIIFSSPAFAGAGSNLIEKNIFRTEFRGLVGSDDFVSLRDSENSVADFVGWSDRVVPPIREKYDISFPQKLQLEKRFADGDWISDSPESLLDSRELALGGSFVRRDSPDTDSAADFAIRAPEIPLDEIATGGGVVRISEILPNPVGADSGAEWFELVNLGDSPVALFGWSVGVASSFFEFENSDELAPGEFRAFRVLPIRNSGATIFVLDADGELVDSVEYPELAEGNSFARNSAGEFTETATPTPDSANGFFQILDPADDADGDGLANSAELELGTDPENFDTDGDGLPDLFEIQNNSDPLVPDATPENLKKYRAELAALADSRFESSTDSGVFLAGVGVPGGRMRIYIQSELQIVEVPIDENGNWNYSLDRALESGAHHIFTQLIDPRGTEGVAQKVLQFSLAENFIPPTFPESIRISEILPNPVGEDSAGEFVELQNFGSAPADISNFTVSAGRKKFTLPENSAIPAGGFLVLPRSESSLALVNSGDEISLALPTGRVIAELEFPKLKEGVAFAFAESEFRPTEKLTPGAANSIFISPEKSSAKKSSTPKNANGNLSDSIRISEIFANPVGDDSENEFVELQNFGSAPVNLGNWTLTDNQKTVAISDSMVIRPGEFKILPRATTKIALNNSGREKISLADFSGKIVDEFEFESPAEGVALAFDSAEIRATKIPTPDSANEFDTEKISGTIEFRGDDGFVVRTSAGEIFVRFGESGSALLARAIFRDGGEYSIFVDSKSGEPTLAGFDISPEFLRTDLLVRDFENSRSNPNWIFALIFSAAIFFAFRFAKMDEVWMPARSSNSPSSRSRR